jgi:putative transposase
MKILTYEEYQDKLKKLRTSKDVSNFAKELVAPVLQEMLEAEMTGHLGYEKHSLKGNNTGNSRNGHSKKTLKTGFGETEIAVPRDRNGEFEPKAVPKYDTVDSDIEERIISMYAKGMTTRDINEHIGDIYGVSISAGMVSTITDKVLPLVSEWQNRPLHSLYPVVYLDGIHFKVRESGKIVNKCGYTVLGITRDGYKELLGIWVGHSEGSKFWLGILTELKNRGIEDILIACVDGLRGFRDAISSVFPETQVQRCIIHQVRHTMKYIPHRHKKAFCAGLKTVYSAASEEAGLEALEQMKKDWPDYSLYLRSWEENWPELSPLFGYPQEIRRIIYTTNAVESIHRQFRKVTKTTTIFPHDEALTKLLWLAQRDISKKWSAALKDWGRIISQLSILFPDRIHL